MIQVIDNFLEDFARFRRHADACKYIDCKNPADGVVYPGISREIPLGVSAAIVCRLERELGLHLREMTLFTRLTLDGQSVPHRAHNDASMGQYGLVVYLNRAEHCRGGTEFVEHKSADPSEIEIMQRDANNDDAWIVTDSADMAPNRAVLFDADLMHRPRVPYGFGSTPADGRLVLVCFFTVYGSDR